MEPRDPKNPEVGVVRRRFLGQSLMLMLVGLSRRVWAQAQALDPFSYQPLARPTVVPLDDLTKIGQAFPFVADGMTLASAATPNQPLRISGMVCRVATGDNAPEKFQAVVIKCPHEGCDVGIVSDPKTLPPEITDQVAKPITEPVYVCPCHNSTFVIEDGHRIAGPAPRGLYRFRVTKVTDSAIEIGEVEEDVLLFP